jgi:thiamine biosynthesis protein ThiS
MPDPSFPKHPARAREATTEAAPETTPAAMLEGRPAAMPEVTPEATPEATIDIVVNGDPRRVAAGATVAALLAELGLADRRVAVERNREVVPRADHARTVLAAGDQLELVTFVGGG